MVHDKLKTKSKLVPMATSVEVFFFHSKFSTVYIHRTMKLTKVHRGKINERNKEG